MRKNKEVSLSNRRKNSSTSSTSSKSAEPELLTGSTYTVVSNGMVFKVPGHLKPREQVFKPWDNEELAEIYASGAH